MISNNCLKQLTEVTAYLIDLMHDRNKDIQRICDSTLDVIAVRLELN